MPGVRGHDPRRRVPRLHGRLLPHVPDRWSNPRRQHDEQVPEMSTTDTERSEPGTRPTASSFGYHPALDGVRAVAIAMVLMVHASITSPWTWTTGWSSWLGVDVFFVLSGFLITTLLLQEIDRRGRGGFSPLLNRPAPPLDPL